MEILRKSQSKNTVANHARRSSRMQNRWIIICRVRSIRIPMLNTRRLLEIQKNKLSK